MIQLRPANLSDTADLLVWRNDPVTCANSRSTATVPAEDHARWMEFNVVRGYPEHIVLIAESDLGKVGVVRFDAKRADVMNYEVGITVAPKHRGKGMGTEMLKQACGFMHDFMLDAEIRRGNHASKTMFWHCGFEEIGSSDVYLQFRREPLP